MQRHTFLKLAASTTFAAGSRLVFPWAAAAATRPVFFGGLLWRANGRGRIQTSADTGVTWKQHSHFGTMYSLRSLAVRNKRLHLDIGYAGRSFTLVLAKDKRSWHTR